ncbi:MAG: HlyC/CorC family transporter [Magnetococcales bacterium]|nr:HlyC/CorC family transporter [Magnetococcales bacterium]
MEVVLVGKLFLILFLVAGNAFFVGSEIAITSARRNRIKQLADMGDRRAKTVQMLQNQPERFYSVTQIGITMVSLALGAVGMVTITEIIDPSFTKMFAMFGGSENLAHTTAYAISFVIIVFLHVVAGELAPKVLAFHKAEPMSMAVGGMVNFMYISMRPVIWIMNHSSNGLLWLFGQGGLSEHSENHFSMSEDEIRMILTASESESHLDASETKMIRGVFDLDEHTVRDAMIPRTDILAISSDSNLADVLKFFKKTRHARFPVFDGDLDHIVGIVAMKEVLSLVAESNDAKSTTSHKVSELMHPPYIVPNSKSLGQLLREFKATRQQMAVVVDEYGGTEGVITLEDILEEIVGEYEDEFTSQGRRVKKIEGSQYEVDASVRISDVEIIVNFPFPLEDDYITLGGLVYKKLGRIPEVGDIVQLDAGRLKVLEMDNHRITKLLFQDLKKNKDGKWVLAEPIPEDKDKDKNKDKDKDKGKKKKDS